VTDEHAESWPVTEAEYRAKLHAEAIARAVLTGIEAPADTASSAAVPEQPEPSPRG